MKRQSLVKLACIASIILLSFACIHYAFYEYDEVKLIEEIDPQFQNQEILKTGEVLKNGLEYSLVITKKRYSVFEIDFKLKHIDSRYINPSVVVLTFTSLDTNQQFQVNLMEENNYKAAIKFNPSQYGIWNVAYQLKTLDSQIINLIETISIN